MIIYFSIQYFLYFTKVKFDANIIADKGANIIALIKSPVAMELIDLITDITNVAPIIHWKIGTIYFNLSY